VLLAECHKWNDTSIDVGSAPGVPEAEDYAREFLDIVNNCHLPAGYGYDPFPRYIIVNKERVVVPPDTNLLLRIVGIQLWVEDLNRKPQAAVAFAHALNKAGIRFIWKPDIRLNGIAAYDKVRIPVTQPKCIVFIGGKPPWSFKSFWFTERRYLLAQPPTRSPCTVLV
jgi:hypothetical protein